jgi:hypothetical protein
MNVPKFLWSEAVLTATYLINRTPSKILAMKTPCEVLLGENKFVVPPKIFGCTCFVRDHRPQVGKLDPRALKCIFVGYPTGQKGYKCWNPSERRLFVSMDVTFRETVPFYGEKTDLNFFLESASNSIDDASREGENREVDPKEHHSNKMEVVIGASQQKMQVVGPNEPESNSSHENNRSCGDNLRYKGEVYTRRKSHLHSEPHETNPSSSTEQFSPDTLETTDAPLISHREIEDPSSHDLPIAIRKGARAKAGVPPTRYGYEHDIGNYVSYASLSPSYRAFVASLHSIAIPRDWKEAQHDSNWREAMLEELKALENNQTWEFVKLPKGKKRSVVSGYSL